MTAGDWFEYGMNTGVSAGRVVLVGYGSRYVVAALAGAERALVGAFCFMLGAVLVRDDATVRSAEEVCRYLGGVIALAGMHRLWFHSTASAPSRHVEG